MVTTNQPYQPDNAYREAVAALAEGRLQYDRESFWRVAADAFARTGYAPASAAKLADELLAEYDRRMVRPGKPAFGAEAGGGMG